MVCAESSASFSKTAAFLMSSLGEATERVTSMVRCSIGTVWVWLSPDCDECWHRRRAAYPGRNAPGDLLWHGGSLVRSRGAARQLLFNALRTQKWTAVEGEAASAPKIGPVARGPSAPRPGAATPPGRAPKMLLGAKCSEKGPPRRLPSCAERRAGTAPAALSHPPPPPRRAGRTYPQRLPALAALLSYLCCSLHHRPRDSTPSCRWPRAHPRGAPLSLHVNLNTGNTPR